MLLDLSPLRRYRDYRLIFLGQFVSFFGSMLTYVALPYQIYQLTHSSLAVGNIGLVQLIPLLATSLFGGALADRLDRRKFLCVTEIGLTISCFVLFINAESSTPHVGLIYLAAGITAALNGFQKPTITAILPRLVEAKDIPAVSNLKMLMFGIVMTAGPASAGFLIAKFHVAIVYLVDALSFFISVWMTWLVKTKLSVDKKQEPILRAIREGLVYASQRQELIGTYLVDFVAMVFGMPMALFPAIADKFGGVTALGWLYAAPSIGMLLASIFSYWTNYVRRHGAMVAIAAAIWGVGIVIFGFTHTLLPAIFFLAIAGGADAISGIFRNTIWNQTVPTELRGRLASLEMISYLSGPLLGNAEAGFVAHIFTPEISIISGGVLCIISVVIALFFLPRFWRYQAA